MSTGPFLADTEQQLDSMLAHITRARATHRTFAAELDLVDEPGAVTLDYDETRAPRAQLQLQCVLPATKAELDRLDPRQGVRVELDLGYVRPDGSEDVATVADMGLRRVVVDYAAQTMTLTVQGDEAMLVDASPVAVGKLDNVASHALGAQTLLNQAINPPPDWVQTGSVGGAVTVDPVSDRWATAQDLADAVGSALYDDGLRTWHWEPVPVLAGTPDVTLATGPEGLVLAPEATLARDAWFNYVQLRYTWRNSSGADQVVTATAYVASGPFAINGDAGKRILLDERRVPTTQARANAAAQSVLRRQLSKSRSFTFEAIAAYWVRPGMTAAVTLPGGGQELHLVSRVAFRPLAGTMTVDTRLPEDYTLATTTPPPAIPTDPPPAPTADPPPPVRTTFVSEWVASASQAYRSNGQKNTVLPDRVAQGYNPGSVNGNQLSLILFTAANSTPAPGKRGETGKTIAQALPAGAQVQRVQVELVPTHTYQSSGGTLRVGWTSDQAAIPATFKSAFVRTNQSGCKVGTPRWVDLTSTELAGALEGGKPLGVTMGPGIGTSTLYYVLVAGATYATASWRPRVRITYTK